MAAMTSHRKRLRFEFGTVERAMAEHPAREDVTLNARATFKMFYVDLLIIDLDLYRFICFKGFFHGVWV